MKIKIENIDDLRLEIGRLEFQCVQQEAILTHRAKAILNKIQTPLNLVDKLHSWFGGNNDDKHKDDHDWVSSALQAILPMALDKIFFRKSGFIVKTLAALASQNAATLISKSTIIGLISKFSDWLKNSKRNKNEDHNTFDFGVPPDSETY